MKCVNELILIVNSGLARVLLAPSCASVVIFIPNIFLRADSFSIAILSLPC
jgi:hypothetical protein